MKLLNFLALILMIIGAINWGFWALFHFDLVAWLTNGGSSMFARLIYGLVGLAGIWGIGFIGKCSTHCSCSRRKSD